MKIQQISKEEVIKLILEGSNEEFYYARRTNRKKYGETDNLVSHQKEKVTYVQIKTISDVTLNKLRDLEEDEDTCIFRILD